MGGTPIDGHGAARPPVRPTQPLHDLAERYWVRIGDPDGPTPQVIGSAVARASTVDREIVLVHGELVGSGGEYGYQG